MRKRERWRQHAALAYVSHKHGPSHQIAYAQARVIVTAQAVGKPLHVRQHRWRPRMQSGRQDRVDNCSLVLRTLHGRHVNLRESIAQRRTQFLFAVIATGIHRGQDLESFRCGHDDVRAGLFGQDQRSLALQHGVEALEHTVISEGNFVEQQHVSLAHGLNEGAVAPREQSERLLCERESVIACLGRLERAQLRGHLLERHVVQWCAEQRGGCDTSFGRERRAIPERALSAEQIGAVCVLVTVERVQGPPEGRGHNVAYRRFSRAGFTDQQHRLVLL